MNYYFSLTVVDKILFILFIIYYCCYQSFEIYIYVYVAYDYVIW